MAKTKVEYGNESISQLKGPDQVRLRPAVIFGSDGIDGCQHAVFEIISNSIDEAREGYGKKILITYYSDNSIEVQDFGRGIPVDYNKAEERIGNWFSANCMQAVNIKPTKGEATNSPWDLTDLVFVLPSIPPSIWTLKSNATVLFTLSISNTVKT